LVNTSIVHSLIAMRLVLISMRALTHINTSELLKKTNRMRNDQLNSMLVYFKCSYVVKSVYNQKVKKGNENVPLKKRLIECVDDDGIVCILTPRKPFWYQYHILNGKNFDAKAQNKFCRRFQLPYK